MAFTFPGSGGCEAVSHPRAVDARSEFQLLQRSIAKEKQAEFA